MITKCTAIVLRISPFSNTSHVVSWLTAEYGKVTTVIKGARRPKSDFMGRYDLFQTCELLFYDRDRSGVHIARECSPIHGRDRLRLDWRATACASYACDLLARSSLWGPHHERLYDLGATALDALCERGACLPFIHWFELRCADALGLAPQLSACSVCGGREARGPSWLFLPERGGLVCRSCATGESSDALPHDVLAIMRAWASAAHPRGAYHTRCTAPQQGRIGEILGRFMNYHLDMALSSRYVAIDLVSADLRKEYGEKR